MQEAQTENLLHKFEEWFKFNNTLLSFNEVEAAIENKSTEKFLYAVKKIFNSASFQDQYFESLLEPDQIISGDIVLKQLEDLFKNKKKLADFELIKPQLKDWKPKVFQSIGNFKDYTKQLWNNCKKNRNDYQVVAEQIFEETVNNKRVYKKFVWVIIGGILILLIYFLFWVIFCKSGKLKRILDYLKYIFSIRKNPSNINVPRDTLNYETVEDEIARYAHYLREHLKQSKASYTYPGSIFKLCKEVDFNFTEPINFFKCLSDEFEKLFVYYCSNPDYLSCETDAINRYSSYIANTCAKGDSSCIDSLLPSVLKEIYSDCIHFIVDNQKCSRKFKILNKYLKKKYLKQYKKFMESPQNWVLPPED